MNEYEYFVQSDVCPATRRQDALTTESVAMPIHPVQLPLAVLQRRVAHLADAERFEFWPGSRASHEYCQYLGRLFCSSCKIPCFLNLRL